MKFTHPPSMLVALGTIVAALAHPATVGAEESIDARTMALAAATPPPSTRVAERVEDALAERPNIALSGDRLAYVNRGGDIIVRSLVSHRRLWIKHGVVTATEAPLAADSERIFTETDRNVVASFAANSGREQWRTSLPGQDISLVAILADGRFVWLHGTNLVAKLDARTGRIIWSDLGMTFIRDVKIRPNFVAVQVCECGGPPLSSVVEILSSRTGIHLGEIGADSDAKFLIAQADGSTFVGLTDRFGVSAAVEIASLDALRGQVGRATEFRPDPKRLDPDTPPPSDIFVSSALTVIRLRLLEDQNLGNASVTYVYANGSPPEKQQPLRLGDLGVPIAVRGSNIWFVNQHGLSVVGVFAGRISKRLAVPFAFEPSALNTYAVSGGTFVMTTTAGDIMQTNTTNGKSRHYTGARCPMVLGVARNADHVAIVCGKDSIPQSILSL